MSRTTMPAPSRPGRSTGLPYDAQGRYNPPPGTEYAFSVSDIGRAAVRLLGDDWDAESHPWGVGADLYCITDPDAGCVLGVDEEHDLFVSFNRSKGKRTYLRDMWSSDGLEALAKGVADTVRSLSTEPS